MIPIQGNVADAMLHLLVRLPSPELSNRTRSLAQQTVCWLRRAGFLSDLFYLQNRLLRQHTYPAGEISGQQSN